MKQIIFKTEAKYITPDVNNKDEIIEVRIWRGEKSSGIYSSAGTPITMSESTYIAFIHAFNAKHEFKY